MLYPISVPIPESADDVIGYVDHLGREAVKPRYRMGSYFSEGLAIVLREDEVSGIIDPAGREKAFGFRGLGQYHEGLCALGDARAVGYVDRQGNWLIEPAFAVAGRFSEGVALASRDGVSFGHIDRRGAFVFDPIYEQAGVCRAGLIAVRARDLWGYVARDGTPAIALQFEGPRAQAFSDGRAGVCRDGLWGFIDPTGAWVRKPEYEDVKRFREGYAPVQRRGKWGLLDANGSISAEFCFDELDEIHDGCAAAVQDGKAGFVSAQGEWVIEPTYDKTYRFVGELAVVRRGDRYGYISREGAVVWTSEPFATVQMPPFLD